MPASASAIAALATSEPEPGSGSRRCSSTAGATERTSSAVANPRPRRQRERLRRPDQRDPCARARAEGEAGIGARVMEQRDDVAVQCLLDVHGPRGRRRLDQIGGAADRCERIEREPARRRLLGEHARLLGARRIAQRDTQQEPVELRLGQRKRALVLDRVLRRQHHERSCERVRLAVDADLPLLHALEERGLRPGRGAVDLVDEHEVREHRPRPERERRRALVEDARAGHVRGQQVGRELQPRNEQSIARASARATSVLPTPGTSSISTWPSATSATTTSSSVPRSAWTTEASASTTARTAATAASRCCPPGASTPPST